MSNNDPINYNCPAIMNDARHITDYRPSNDVFDLLIKQNNLRNSNETRQFLINNTTKIMAKSNDFYAKKNGCDSCYFYQVDPNRNNQYWENYQNYLGMNN